VGDKVSLTELMLLQLQEIGAIEHVVPQEAEKPGHGTCCTCQTCGRPYDECVCDENRIIEAVYDVLGRP